MERPRGNGEEQVEIQPVLLKVSDRTGNQAWCCKWGRCLCGKVNAQSNVLQGLTL